MLLATNLISASLLALVSLVSSEGAVNAMDARQYVADFKQCPQLAPRTSPPTSVHDLRPDDIKVVMALGDSLTAAFGAEKFMGDFKDWLKNLFEYRGKSFSIGADPGMVTIPNILSHYRPDVVGGSKGSHLVHYCSG
jgi:phospholipase B1